MEPRVCVATPIFDRPSLLYNESLHKLLLSGAISNYSHLVGATVHMARNFLVEWALDEDGTHIWFVDSDQFGFDAEMLKGLLAHDVDIVGPLNFRRHPPYDPVIYEFDERGWHRSIVDYPRKSFFEVGAVGMGCCLIRTSVFEKISWPWFHPAASIDKRFSGEDIMFCNLARAAGFKVYADTNYCVSHIADWAINEEMWDLIQKRNRLQAEKVKAEEKK